MAKEILESNIKEKHTKVFKIKQLSDVQIPTKVNDNLMLFTQDFISNVNLNPNITNSTINTIYKPELKTQEDKNEHVDIPLNFPV